MNKEVEVLIISNSMDFTTDLICIELNKRNVKYVRLNRDMFNKYKIKVDIENISMFIGINEEEYIISDKNLVSIYYRAPVFLRENFTKYINMEKQLYRSQWMSFMRNLSIFENCRWVNNPNSTFTAEDKLLQLKKAKEIGFNIPNTLLVNSLDYLDIKDEEQYVVKSLDTVLLKHNNKESFAYTNIISGKELKKSRLDIAPIIFQKYISGKTDIRATVIGNKIIPLKIEKNNIGINGDWRLEKENVEYSAIKLPEEIEKKCIKIVETFKLSFGGIDLVEKNGKYYFIEINPTGEWAWLNEKSNSRIDKAICDYLLKKDVEQ